MNEIKPNLLVSIEENITNVFYDRTEQLRDIRTLMGNYAKFAFLPEPLYEPNSPLRLVNRMTYVGCLVTLPDTACRCLKCHSTVREWEEAAKQDTFPLTLTFAPDDRASLLFQNTPVTAELTVGRTQQAVFEALDSIETFTVNTHRIRNTLTEKGGEVAFTYDLFNRQSFCISIDFTAKAVPLRSPLPIFDYGRI